jgi:hypothetical protein
MFAQRQELVFASVSAWYRIVREFNLRRPGVRALSGVVTSHPTTASAKSEKSGPKNSGMPHQEKSNKS